MGDSEQKKSVSIDGQELELEFPCPWTYTVVALDETLLAAAVESILEDVSHKLELSHASKGGKYRSMHLEVTVQDDAHRLAIFKQLQDHPDVAYVL